MKRITSHFAREIAFLSSMPAVLWQIFFMVGPLAVIFYFSVSSDHLPFTLAHYWALFKYSYFIIITRSLLLAFGTAFVALILAYPMAYFLAIRVKRFKHLMLFLLTLPFWVNFLVQVYSWYYLLEYKGLINNLLIYIGIINEPLELSNNLWAIFLVMVYCYLPFMIMPLYNALEKIDVRLLAASADLGATPWQTFTRITLPLSMPGIRTGSLLVLIPAFGEFVIPSLLGGSKYMLTGSLIAYLFLVARNNALGAAFTILSGAFLVLILTTFYAINRLWILRALWGKK